MKVLLIIPLRLEGITEGGCKTLKDALPHGIDVK